MTRHPCTTQKINRKDTGLRGSVFVHVDWNQDGTIAGVRCSTKWKEKDHTIDRLLTALGDALTEIVRE